ncbi:SH3 domain-containing protein [Rubellimicrobium rubrum]|uniref:SH3 domain-containing protein n=1 Tax=Rubellimicrobium rubrum TaxID=2585369 RepID=A0A5C4MKE0_9RHOB|nr:SH3 domain-containing protein [Rubellimicrobium rubrum]TNC46068.1 SH3 domain-containing protein [Rubellimicrobium rubrum]
MPRGAAPALLALVLLTGCSAGDGGRTVVQGAGPDEFLKLRAGPGPGHHVVLSLTDDTSLVRSECVTQVGQPWCRVSLSDASQTTGNVSADHLSGP